MKQPEEPKAEPIMNTIDEHPTEPKAEPTTKVIKPKHCIMNHIKTVKYIIENIIDSMPGPNHNYNYKLVI
jgi:hypothetical protein